MKTWILGLICGAALTGVTVVSAAEMLHTDRQVVLNGKLLDTQVQVAEDGTTMTSTRAIAEALGAKVNWNEPMNTVEIRSTEDNGIPYANYVSLLLHGRYSLKYEILGENLGAHSDTTVVFSEGYGDVPDNADFQKLFLLLLVDQIGDLPNKHVEFWSNKELAQAYVSGEYHEDGIEGWSGLKARFGLLTNEGGTLSLSHILSVHERDSIFIGKYKR